MQCFITRFGNLYLFILRSTVFRGCFFCSVQRRAAARSDSGPASGRRRELWVSAARDAGADGDAAPTGSNSGRRRELWVPAAGDAGSDGDE